MFRLHEILQLNRLRQYRNSFFATFRQLRAIQGRSPRCHSERWAHRTNIFEARKSAYVVSFTHVYLSSCKFSNFFFSLRGVSSTIWCTRCRSNFSLHIFFESAVKCTLIRLKLAMSAFVKGLTAVKNPFTLNQLSGNFCDAPLSLPLSWWSLWDLNAHLSPSGSRNCRWTRC